tara:strand:- start:532 stop:657 length:126 start_codon:yes stop_codon:yes gene_type:complete
MYHGSHGKKDKKDKKKKGAKAAKNGRMVVRNMKKTGARKKG